MCPIVDGSAVDAANTNSQLLDAVGDDIAEGKIGFENTDVASGKFIANTQKLQNNVADTIGLDNSGNYTAEADTTGKTYGAPANTINDGDGHKQAIKKLADKFDDTTGHAHTGAAGEGAPITASDLISVPLKGSFVRGTDLTGVTGGSTDVSTEMTGKTPSTGSTIEGVAVNAPYNRIIIRDTNNEAIEDGSGNQVYGRLTESSGTWTLTYYSEPGGTETPYSFSSTNIYWYYQELFNPMVNPPVYSELAIIPSDNITQDVIDATTSIKGKTQLSSSAPGAIASTGSAGTANATVANADHTHAGVRSVNGLDGTVVVDTDDIPEGANLYFTDARARTAVVDDAIVDGVTNKAPSQNAVFDALATKQPTGNYITDLTGDVTASGPGSAAATIAANAVTNTKAADMATQTIKGRTTAGTGDPEDLTATQATAILNNFVGDSGSGGTKGMVPAPAAGDNAAGKFLKAGGTWEAPSISGSTLQSVAFTTSNTWNVPSGVTEVIILGFGAGGGGGGGADPAATPGGGGGGGGGGAGIMVRTVQTVTPSDTLTITIGAGGSGGASEADGSTGGNSSISGTGWLQTFYGGGGGGRGATSNAVTFNGLASAFARAGAGGAFNGVGNYYAGGGGGGSNSEGGVGGDGQTAQAGEAGYNGGGGGGTAGFSTGTARSGGAGGRSIYVSTGAAGGTSTTAGAGGGGGSGRLVGGAGGSANAGAGTAAAANSAAGGGGGAGRNTAGASGAGGAGGSGYVLIMWVG